MSNVSKLNPEVYFEEWSFFTKLVLQSIGRTESQFMQDAVTHAYVNSIVDTMMLLKFNTSAEIVKEKEQVAENIKEVLNRRFGDE